MPTLRSLHLLGLIFVIACGTANQAGSYVPKTKKEQARAALDEKDYEAAATLYAEVLEEFPEDYASYTLYATALAGKGGISLLSVVLDQLTGGGGGEEGEESGGGGGGVLTLIDKIVPEEVTDDKTASVKSAVEVLRGIPESAFEEDSELSSSADLQMTVYSAVYTAMLVDSILDIQAGEISQESLENLTVDQAMSIIDAFILAGSVGDPDNPLTQAMAAAGQEVSGATGEEAKSKLQEYLNSQQGQTLTRNRL